MTQSRSQRWTSSGETQSKPSATVAKAERMTWTLSAGLGVNWPPGRRPLGSPVSKAHPSHFHKPQD